MHRSRGMYTKVHTVRLTITGGKLLLSVATSHIILPLPLVYLIDLADLLSKGAMSFSLPGIVEAAHIAQLRWSAGLQSRKHLLRHHAVIGKIFPN